MVRNIDSDQDLLSLKIQMYERNLNVHKRIENIENIGIMLYEHNWKI